MDGVGLTLGDSRMKEPEREEGDTEESEEDEDDAVGEESRLYSMRMGGPNGNGGTTTLNSKQRKQKTPLQSRGLAVLSLRSYPAQALLLLLSILLILLVFYRPRQPSPYQANEDVTNLIPPTVQDPSLKLDPGQPPAEILRPLPPLSASEEDRISHSSYSGSDQDDVDHPPRSFTPLTKAELVALVGQDPKFLIRENHGSGYGYNNVRYIFESTLLWGKVLKRIPVIPDAVWGRSCAVETYVLFSPPVSGGRGVFFL